MFAARTIDAENVAPMRTGAGNFDNAKGGKVTAYAMKDQKFWADLSQAAARDVEALDEANTCAHQWRAEAERLRAQLADKSAALQKLHAVYERTVQESRRVEDEAQAERHALHAERRQLELRLQEEGRRAQKAVEALEKLKREGLLGRLFSGGDAESNGDGHAQARSLPVRLPPDAGRV